MKEQVLFIEYIGMSTNDFYKLHHHGRSSEKKKCMQKVIEAVEKYGVIKMEYPVKITFQPILGNNLTGRCKRTYDIVNYSATIKMIEDSLVQLDYFVDDSNKYVFAHNTEKPVVDRSLNSTGILIIITPAEIKEDYLSKLLRKHNIDL